MKKQAVFSIKIAGILARAGFKVVDQVPNKNDLTLDVFYFERTPELEKALSAAIASISK